MSELESSLTSFAASDSFSALFVIQVVNFELDRRDNKREDGERGRGDYSTETIILNIPSKGGNYSSGAY